jgi:Immunity protein 42
MIFGDPADFAVEAFHEPLESRFRGFGRLCIHVQGLALGDIEEEHCSLFHSADDLERLAADAAGLWDASFEGHSDKSLFELLAYTLFDYHGQTDAEIDQAYVRYGRYSVLTNSGEHFDGFNIFVVCREFSRAHFLFRRPDNSIGSRDCSLKMLCDAIQQFQNWFRAVSVQLNDPHDGSAAREL